MSEKKEMTLEKQIKNLQVSVSIAKREIKDRAAILKSAKPDEKMKIIERIAQLEQIIAKKEKELEPLKKQRGTTNGNRSKVTVSREQVADVAKRYNVSLS